MEGNTSAKRGDDVPEIPSHIFRAYDIRGIAGDELTDEGAYRIGLAFGERCFLAGLRGVALGGDNRPSTPALSEAFAQGVIEAGPDVYDVGLQPTPVVYFARVMLKGVGVAVITASHNPKAYNGIKLGYADAALSEEEIQDLGRSAQTARASGIGRGRRRLTAVHDAYVEEWTRLIGGPHNLKVVVDCGNGTAGLYEPSLSQVGAGSATGIFIEPDADYPNHHPDPSVPKNLEALARRVQETGSDIGVAYDGDADRLGLVDDRGRFVPLDRLMILLWEEILRERPGAPALVEVKCSKLLYEAIERWGGHPEFCRSGHAPIKILMKAKGVPFAGELSGHFFFSDHYHGYDDGLYAAGRVYQLLARGDRPLSERIDTLPKTVATPEIRFEVSEQAKFAQVDRMARAYKSRYPVVTVDGVRVLFPRGWALVRASNTQPVAVFRAEGDDEEALSEILADVGHMASVENFDALAKAVSGPEAAERI